MASVRVFNHEAAAEYDRAFAHINAYFMPTPIANKAADKLLCAPDHC
jgi:hypothetical protein